MSVITTVRNGQRFIRATARSVLESSLTNLEWVVVDDGSSDATWSILEELQLADGRVHAIRTSGVGRGHALNMALEHAAGPYVAILDADDLAHRLRFELQAGTLSRHAEYTLVASGVKFAQAEDDVPTDYPLGTDAPSLEDVTKSLPRGNPIAHSAVMARREALAGVRGYDAERRGQFDYDLYVRLARCGRRLAMMKAPLCVKRLHPGQSFERRARLRYLSGAAQVQFRALVGVRFDLLGLVLLPARFLWGLLPAGVRMRARRGAFG